MSTIKRLWFCVVLRKHQYKTTKIHRQEEGIISYADVRLVCEYCGIIKWISVA